MLFQFGGAVEFALRGRSLDELVQKGARQGRHEGQVLECGAGQEFIERMQMA